MTDLAAHPVLSNTIRLGIVNIQSLRQHCDSLTSFILDNNISACAVSECRIREGYGPGHLFIKSFIAESSSTSGNAAALHPDLIYSSISFLNYRIDNKIQLHLFY